MRLRKRFRFVSLCWIRCAKLLIKWKKQKHCTIFFEKWYKKGAMSDCEIEENEKMVVAVGQERHWKKW